MKRILCLIVAAALALQSYAGPFAASAGGSAATDATLSVSDVTTNDVSTSAHGFAPKAPNDAQKYLRGDATWAVSSPPSAAFASLPNCATNSGAVWRATDVGEAPGSLLICNGTRWKPLNGRLRLKTLGAPVTGLTNSEAISLQASLPSGLLAVNDMVEVYATGNKSGATDTPIVTVRMGTAGTTADAAILPAEVVGVAGTLSFGQVHGFKFTSATASQRLGDAAASAANIGGMYGGGGTTALPATVAVSNITSNALFISVAMTSSGATNTIGFYSGQIDWVTP